MLSLSHQSVALTNLNFRNEKHGADQVPAIDLSVKVDIGSDRLNEIKPGLRETLYRQPRRGDQLRLADDNDASAYTELRHPDLEPLCIKGEFPGYEVSFVENVAADEEGKEPEWEQRLFLVDVTLKALKIDAREGGTSTVSFKLSASDIDLDDDLREAARAVQQQRAVLVLTPPSAQSEPIAANDDSGDSAHDEAA